MIRQAFVYPLSVFATLQALSFAALFHGSDPAHAAFPDLTIIYRASGVTDDGQGEEVGIATAFHCTNFSNKKVRIKFLLRGRDGALVSAKFGEILPKATYIATTHDTQIFGSDVFLSEGISFEGSIQIAATHPNVLCSAMIVDATTDETMGMNLPMVRYNPAPGTTE
jgi:hypothetical protein